jgi:hypothetical protein
VDRIGGKAEELRSEFADYFIEVHQSSYAMRYPLVKDPAVQFASFLVESEKIARSLTEQLDAYFLNRSPGAVRLDEYRSSSIVVLMDALSKLSQLVKRAIK